MRPAKQQFKHDPHDQREQDHAEIPEILDVRAQSSINITAEYICSRLIGVSDKRIDTIDRPADLDPENRRDRADRIQELRESRLSVQQRPLKVLQPDIQIIQAGSDIDADLIKKSGLILFGYTHQKEDRGDDNDQYHGSENNFSCCRAPGQRPAVNDDPQTEHIDGIPQKYVPVRRGGRHDQKEQDRQDQLDNALSVPFGIDPDEQPKGADERNGDRDLHHLIKQKTGRILAACS